MDTRRNNSRRKYPTQVLYHPPVLKSTILSEVTNLVEKNPDGIPIRKIMEYVKDRISYKFEEQHLTRQLREFRSREIIVKSDYLYPRKECKPWKTSPPKNTAMTMRKELAANTLQSLPAGMSDDDDGDEDDVDAANMTRFLSTNSNKINTLHEESRDNDCYVTDEQLLDLLINEKIRFRLKKLIENHPDGIWCAELPSLYQREYKISLDYEELGFYSVNDFASNLPKIFHCERFHETGDFKLFDANQPIPEQKNNKRLQKMTLAALHNNSEKNYTDREPAVPDSLSLSVLQRLIPNGVMSHGDKVPEILVTGLFPGVNSSVKVVVVHAVSPSFFWIQIQKNIPKFMTFMAELQTFYNFHASEYIIPRIMLKSGLYCVALFKKKWRRAQIKTVKPDNTVTVFFYDNGKDTTCPAEAIYFLHRSFSYLPAQAISCGLYGIKPMSTTRWTYETCKEFFDIVLQVPWYAVQRSINEMNNSMLIVLTDIQADKGLSINEWMIKNGYAIRGKVGDTVHTTETHPTCYGNKITLIPKILPTRRELLEKSIEDSAKSFFDELELKARGFNLFEINIENNKFITTNQPTASLSTSNPFARKKVFTTEKDFTCNKENHLSTGSGYPNNDLPLLGPLSERYP